MAYRTLLLSVIALFLCIEAGRFEVTENTRLGGDLACEACAQNPDLVYCADECGTDEDETAASTEEVGEDEEESEPMFNFVQTIILSSILVFCTATYWPFGKDSSPEPLNNSVEEDKLVPSNSRVPDELLTKLSGTTDHVLNLPIDKPRSKKTNKTSAKVAFSLPESVSKAIATQQQSVSFLSQCLALVKVVLFQYSNETDIVVGVRSSAIPENFPIRSTIDQKVSFEKLVSMCDKEIAEIKQNYNHITFKKLLEDLNVAPDESAHSIFQASVSTTLSNQMNNQHLDFEFQFYSTGKEISCTIHYASDIYDRETVERMSKHLQLIADQVFLQMLSQEPVHRLDKLLPSERSFLAKSEIVLADFGIPEDECWPDWFMKYAKENPKAPCLWLPDGTGVNYGEFNEKVMKLAALLQGLGIKMGDIVGITCEDTFNFVLATCAIICSGGAYCTLDTENPVKRQQFLIEDTKARVVITENKYLNTIREASSSVHILTLDDPTFWKNKTTTTHSWVRQFSPDSLAYCLYTSGSTGNPKGVLIEHKALTNQCYAISQIYKGNGSSKTDVGIQLSKKSFDSHVSEIFPRFMCGGQLVLLKPQGNLDFPHIIERINAHSVSTVDFVPSLAAHFITHVIDKNQGHLIQSLRNFTGGGEPWVVPLLQKIFGVLPNAHVINLYGPTECTVQCTYRRYTAAEMSGTEAITIGKAIANYGCHVLDEKGNHVIPGCSGTLFISGKGLMRHYLNLPQKSQQALITLDKLPYTLPSTQSLPKSLTSTWSGPVRLYNSGDLARYSVSTGEMHLMGRKDSQVKIRGQRLELGEIEAVIMESKYVKNVVVAKVDVIPGSPSLAAYMLKDKSIPDDVVIEDAKRTCNQKLLKYMVPSWYIPMESFPVNQSQKVDRAKLPVPKLDSGHVVQPANETETKLRKFWGLALRVSEEQISTSANFFDLGGDSLLATKLLESVRRDIFSGISFSDILENQTIQSQAKFLDKKKGETVSRKKRAPLKIPQWSPKFFLQQTLGIVLLLLHWTICIGLSWSIATSMSQALFEDYDTETLFEEDIETINVNITKPVTNNHFFVDDTASTWASNLFMFPIAYFIFTLVNAFGLIAWKKALLPATQPGVYQIYGDFYLRWWIFGIFWVSNTHFMSYLFGTNLYNMYLRLLGAKIGNNSQIWTYEISLLDMIEIGDNCYIGKHVMMHPNEFRDWKMTVQKIKIGNNSTVGERSVVCGSANIPPFTQLWPCSRVDGSSNGNSYGKDEQMHTPTTSRVQSRTVASPASPSPYSPASSASVSSFETVLQSAFQFIVIASMILLVEIATSGVFLVTAKICNTPTDLWSTLTYYVTFTLLECAATVVVGVLLSLVLRFAARNVSAGSYPVNSWFTILHFWFPSTVMNELKFYLSRFIGTGVLNMFLSLMGASVNSSARITNIDKWSPPFTFINIDHSFAAQDVHITPHISYGMWHVKPTYLRNNTFVGNDTVVVGGTDLAEGTLVGCSSLVQPQKRKSNQVLLGIPAVEFPKPAEDGKINSHPGVWRDFVELIVVSLLPPFLNYLSFGLMFGMAYLLVLEYPILTEIEITHDVPILVLLFPVGYLAFMVLSTIIYVSTKWLLVQNYHKSDHAYNSMWMLRYSAVMIAEEFWHTWCGDFIKGTQAYVFVQKLLGAKIGKNCLLFGFLLHQDLCIVGDNTILEEGSCLQNHSWSRGQIVLDEITFGDESYLGKAGFILRGAKVNKGVGVDHLTLILRNDELPENTNWCGAPARVK